MKTVGGCRLVAQLKSYDLIATDRQTQTAKLKSGLLQTGGTRI